MNKYSIGLRGLSSSQKFIVAKDRFTAIRKYGYWTQENVDNTFDAAVIIKLDHFKNESLCIRNEGNINRYRKLAKRGKK